ncbi:PEP-CTERM sorting domain-containing protein [Planctomycetales bacterium ZRK34]|nr:PEP-CTERM sorting domain-containing protein [Planctomycetales bacterium ZRK34]
MIKRLLTVATLAVAGLSASTSHAVVTDVNLSNYQLDGVYSLTIAADEASGVTYNPDTGTLFVIGDEGRAIVEYDTQGNQLGLMSLTGFDDTEGITYIGNGEFIVVEEREQDLYRLTYTAFGSATRGDLPMVSIGPNVGNSGIEGITYDTATGKYFAVKEKNPQAVYELDIDWDALSIVVNPLFDPALLDLASDDLSDVQILSTVPSLLGTADQNNLLIYSQEGRKLLEVTPAGDTLSTFELANIGDAEGVTIDPEGTIYIVGETPALYVLKPVPEPAAIATALLGLLAIKPRRKSSRTA